MNATRVFTWLMVVAICIICFTGTNLVIMDGLVSDIIQAIFFRLLIQRFILQAVAFVGITACLTISYMIIVNRTTNKERVKLVYAVIGLLIALSFVFSEYQNHQEKLTIRDVCIQYDLAVGRNDFETAYEFMSPNYRQIHSLAQFTAGEGSRLTCGYPSITLTFSKSLRVLLLYPKAREASVIQIPFGSLNTEILLEQVDGRWYLTGKTRSFIG